MPTRREVARTNAVSFAQLLQEILPVHPGVKDIYYCDHTGVWCINYEKGYWEEFETFSDLLHHLTPPEQDTKLTAAQINELASGCWVKDLRGMEDGQLIGLRLSYMAMAETRRDGQPCKYLADPMRVYPAEVWDRCAEYVNEEIARRTASKKGGRHDD